MNVAGEGFDVLSWYMEIPPVSRIYFTSAFLTTTCCAVDIINPYYLYYNPELIFEGQIWRLFSPFLFFGLFSVDFMFNMYFLVRHCRQLEEGDFRGKPSQFVLMILFGISLIVLIAPFLQMHNFLGSALTFMMTYVWGRRNEDVRMSMFGVITFTAPYLPWVMLAFGFLVGNPVDMSLVGIAVGHAYYFLEYIYPVVAKVRGWKRREIFVPPRFFRYICGEEVDEVIMNANLQNHNE
uniref:Derlin n=1 Tax=Chaetoceros debilis TaxID=122233 RepID=A0A7S3VFZ7_9STRA|mmetsp:Transcript_19431/g.29417  ORF Transcript_19431/g.29417 Transcript_19431/m.29417 type:complete len:237 (+) Transcript_19431:153-863(+)